ncbi:NUDIX hydrolase domain-like protein [Xylariaceae sp. FL0662B]|nr:NUDIX hydrolase domain-like protein [Xylariaceae sp. FL0662B]
MGDTQAPVTYLSLVQSCDNFPYDNNIEDNYYQLFLPEDDEPYGYLLPETVRKMPWTARFRVRHDKPRSVTVVDASQGTDPRGAINEAFAELVDICLEENRFHILDGQHSEPFAIVGYAKQPVHIERFASALFGITARGAALVAYTVTAEGSMRLWIPRRAEHLYTGAGMLDITVAGGVRAGATPFDTVVQEAHEEASFPGNFTRGRVRSRGVLTYISTTGGPGFPGEKGLVVPLMIFVYDMEVPPDIVPKPHDGEVKDFRCLSVEEVQRALLNGEFKDDAAAVMIDFLIRHGVVTADNERDFVEISIHLHRRLPFRTAPRKQ